jgi:hypothetical protein
MSIPAHTAFRSPIAIFATLCRDFPSETKIRMLRLFVECLDITEPEADDWIVHAALKSAASMEKAPPSKSAITWLMRATASEPYVTFGSKTIWTATQSAVRSFLVQERDGAVLERILGIDSDLRGKVTTSHLEAFAHWFALRAAGRELLPMVLDAGRFCQIQGFDWVKDDITPSQFIKALPVIYAAWAVAMPNGLDQVLDSVKAELDICLEKLGWTQTAFLETLLSAASQDVKVDTGNILPACSECGDCYGRQCYGLVQPARIQFLECIKTDHRRNCKCLKFQQDVEPNNRTTPGHSFEYNSDSDTESTDEEFFDAEADPTSAFTTDQLPNPVDTPSDPFLDAATMLYRAQGRNWIGEYKSDEILCATCYLRRERYIADGSLRSEEDFTPMPESFAMYRSDVEYCTVEVDSN